MEMPRGPPGKVPLQLGRDDRFSVDGHGLADMALQAPWPFPGPRLLKHVKRKINEGPPDG
jgi:hypothetical protein